MLTDLTIGSLSLIKKSETTEGTSFYEAGAAVGPTTLSVKHTEPRPGQRYTPTNAPVVRRVVSINVPEKDSDGLLTGRSVTMNVSIVHPVNATAVDITKAGTTLVRVLTDDADADIGPLFFTKVLNGEQ